LRKEEDVMMVQVVERSIQLHLQEGASSNVLSFGYGQVSTSHCLLEFLSLEAFNLYAEARTKGAAFQG
jgi:hypothetical protein